MKILHRIRGETGKRCLSFVLAFSILASIMPAMLPEARAVSPGIAELHWEELPTGQYHIWGRGIPTKAGSAVGGISFDPYYTGADGSNGHLAYKPQATVQWTDAAKREEYTFDYKFYSDYIGSQTITFNIWDSTSGQRLTYSSSFKCTTTAKNLNPQFTVPTNFTVYTVSTMNGGFSYHLFTGQAWGRPITDSRVLWSTDGVNYKNFYRIGNKPLGHEKGNITGLQNGTKYYVKFQLTNAAGTGTSRVFEVTPGSPAAPQNLRITVGSGSATYTWDPPADWRGGTPQNYKIYSAPGATEAVATISTNATRSYTLTGLTNGTMYLGTGGGYGYGVRAVSSYGEGEYGAFPVNFWVGAPQAPKAPTITKTASSRSIKIATNAPTNNGATITQYNIYVNNNLKKSVSGATLNSTLDAKNDLGLADNTAYSISVSATNSRGEGLKSAATNFTTNGPPAKPTLSSAEATKVTGQAKLTWTTPANNGGPITAVQILQNGSVVKTLSAVGTPNEWQAGKMDTPGQVSTNFVTGLKDGTSYSFQVRAVNAYGQGTLSDAKSAMPYRIPDAPGGLKVTRGVRSLTLNWSAAANGGNAVSKYNVYASTKAPKKL